MTRSRIAVLSLAVLSAVLVWALPAGAQATKPHVTKVTVTAGSPTEFKFKLSKSKVAKGVVTFTVKNSGQLPHDFKIGNRKTREIQPGKSATLRVTFAKAGKYPYLCTVTGHAAAGMKGTLVVA
jgi:uncharacterized cupredoxin-like copper-binding protein